ncbi:hypothetical protein AVEN_214446-1 [Araneus ventricosus]|uniref:Reverse transcriptase domain-containing protein n=1 Tax=Araneus ventricosus TaxID=182803 RepID=A0A4Y2SJQ5_ARAVE|nr:hypothetical protein AVEN_214446-1 [Araneus ventricosus]
MEDLDANLRKFWEIENVEADKIQNDESLICEDHFMKTHFRNNDGSYVVKIPFKTDPPCLGESKHIATKRLNSLWKRLKREPEYIQLYREFLTEYENRVHMQATCESPRYIMPHHNVFRPDSSATKLRVVFNASEPTSSGQSLNDNLHTGSVVQDDLFAILLRFRKHSVVFTADIKKMYRQIWVHPDQCDLQCILWKGVEDEKLSVFKLLTVTYGTKCAPYLAARVLQQLLSDEQDNYPLAAAAGKDFYVDDILSGTEDLSSALEL